MPEAFYDGLVLMLSQVWLVPIGVCLGIFVGAMPGLTSSNSLAILLPVMIAMEPHQGLILGVSIYAGAEMGNSFPAITLRIPGTAASAVTAIEGYPMMRAGRGAYALGICILASTIGALIGGIASLGAAPLIALAALQFSPVEITVVILFGIAVIAMISQGGMKKGLMAGFLGLLLATVGTDPVYGQFRGTMGLVGLFDGITVIAVLVGLLGFSEAITYVEKIGEREPTEAAGSADTLNFKGMMEGFVEVIRRPFEWLRASVIGVILGAVPGAGASVSAFIAYQQSMSFASGERRKLFGKGSPEGLMAADTANNAMVGGSLVPLLTLGIPGSASMAVLLVVMGYHGLSVGPTLFEREGEIAYAVLWSQFVAAFFVLVLGTLLAYVAFYAARVQVAVIVPIVSIFCMIGGFAKTGALFDIGVMLFFGVLGYFMKKHNYPTIALLLGLILGGLFEAGFFRGLLMGFNSPLIFFQRPIAQVLWVIMIVTLAGPPLVRWLRPRGRNKGDDSERNEV